MNLIVSSLVTIGQELLNLIIMLTLKKNVHGFT